MMRNLALEWGKYGIRVCSIVPGPIEGTEGMRRLSDPAARREHVARIPLQRFGTVDDIGQMAVILASPLCSYVTGTQVIVDGGSSLAGSAPFNSAAEKVLQSQRERDTQ
jgi:NAD(P)-dependent dehydrogenase (short-subunit alcohol dehydrogenase family)